MENLKLKLIEAVRQIDECYLEFCLPVFSVDISGGSVVNQAYNESFSKEEIVNMACDIRNSLRKVFIIIMYYFVLYFKQAIDIAGSMSDSTMQCLFEMINIKKEAAASEAKHRNEIEVCT